MLYFLAAVFVALWLVSVAAHAIGWFNLLLVVAALFLFFGYRGRRV